MEEQPQTLRPGEIHGDAADQVGEILRPNLVGDDHYREERNQRGKKKAVNENDEAGFFEILELGMLDFAIHLRQRLFAAHGKHGVAESDENDDRSEKAERRSEER